MRRVFLAVMLLLAAAPVDQTAVCLAIFNAKRVELTERDGIDRPPLILHPALVDEAKRHLWEQKKFHYFADIGADGESLGVRACQDPAVEPGYPCRATTWVEGPENHDITGWVTGVGAKGNREARSMCKLWLDERFPDWRAITNPKFVHVGIEKQGDMWATFLGWPQVTP